MALAADERDGQFVDVDLNAATVVTVKVSGDAAEAADALAQQANVAGEITFVRQGNRALPKVDLQVNAEPLLAGVAKLGITAKAMPWSGVPRVGILALQQGQGEEARTILSAPVSHHGPLAVFLTEVSSWHQLPVTGGENQKRNVSLHFQLLAEPKVSIAAASHEAEIEEASDSDGANLVGTERRQSHHSWNTDQQRATRSFQVSVNQVPREVAKFAVLKGTMRVRAVKKFVVWNLSPGPEKQEVVVDEVTCLMEPIKKTGPRSDPRVIIRIPRAEMDDAAWSTKQEMMQASRFVALDAEGKRLSESWRGHSRLGDAMVLNLNFSQQPTGVGALEKLIWHAPVEVEELTVPFEFKDVPVTY